MELDGETFQIRVIHAFAASVIGIPEGFRSDTLQGVGNDRVAVILGCDIGAAGCQVADGLVAAAVAVFQLDGITAQGEGCQLMAQADAEDRLFADQLHYWKT